MMKLAATACIAQGTLAAKIPHDPHAADPSVQTLMTCLAFVIVMLAAKSASDGR